ncbi:hypothetical protein [Rhodohalobacter halophilus]|uniref:hypothetical protein n=1 Tax=Rhodohalobacter halophilus TaxID=1812810 RepID=UPI00083F52E9|nr:hypothetical protein [Rhodohalobacter halophilus]
MNGRTKSYTPWIIVGLIIVVLIFAEYLLTSVYSVFPHNSWIYYFINSVVIPGSLIRQHITIEAINWFGGNDVALASFYRMAFIIVAGMLVLFVFLPWLFLKGRLTSLSEEKEYPIYWYFTAAFLCLAILLSSFSLFQQTNVSANNKQSLEASRTLDQLRSYMVSVAFDAAEWWILPQEAGGGGGTFAPERGESFALNKLSSYDANYSDFDITIEGEPKDSTVILIGKVINNSNEDGTQVQRSLEVTPYDDSLFKFLNNHFSD